MIHLFYSLLLRRVGNSIGDIHQRVKKYSCLRQRTQQNHNKTTQSWATFVRARSKVAARTRRDRRTENVTVRKNTLQGRSLLLWPMFEVLQCALASRLPVIGFFFFFWTKFVFRFVNVKQNQIRRRRRRSIAGTRGTGRGGGTVALSSAHNPSIWRTHTSAIFLKASSSGSEAERKKLAVLGALVTLCGVPEWFFSSTQSVYETENRANTRKPEGLVRSQNKKTTTRYFVRRWTINACRIVIFSISRFCKITFVRNRGADKSNEFRLMFYNRFLNDRFKSVYVLWRKFLFARFCKTFI